MKRNFFIAGKLFICGALFSAALMFAQGCSSDPYKGYSFETGLYRQDIKTVAVPIWRRGDKVYRRDLEQQLTEALVKRIELDSPYKVADKSIADTMLEGTIVAVTQRVLSFNPSQGTPRDVELRIVVDFTWTDQRTGEILVQKKGFRAAGVYYPAGALAEDFSLGSADAVNHLAQLIVETMEKPW
ncbi:MAG: LptE family protein [Planctomycetes bacterium]|nr:LptE family protein [Planctomycetota bacterium]